MGTQEKTRFLNVDLDLYWGGPALPELLLALEPDLFVLHQDEHRASLELSEQPEDVEAAITGFAERILRLPPDVRALWDRCGKRTMDIGIQSGEQPSSAYFTLSSRTVALLASIQAELVFTVYGSARG
jgi:hypothetical protein